MLNISQPRIETGKRDVTLNVSRKVNRRLRYEHHSDKTELKLSQQAWWKLKVGSEWQQRLNYCHLAREALRVQTGNNG